jgi:hypothetical protein
MITVANAEPENKKNPPRADSSVTLDKSSGKDTAPANHFADPQGPTPVELRNGLEKLSQVHSRETCYLTPLQNAPI